MKLNLSIVTASDFIRTTPVGTLDMDVSLAVLKRIRSVTEEREDYRVLVDLRQARSALSLTDIWYIARELETCADTFRRKTALLTRENSREPAEFFELSAQNRGFRVRVFTDFEAAIYWLSFTVEATEENLPSATGTG